MNSDQKLYTVAAQSGLLELIAVLLAIVTILIAIAAIYFFFNLNRTAKTTAEKEARRICPEVAEHVANRYIQEQLPAILEEYKELGWGSVGNTNADDIAGAQDDEDG